MNNGKKTGSEGKNVMRWNDLLALVSLSAAGGEGNPEIVDVACDSRRVVPGSLYVSIPGLKQNGDAFIDDAIAGGAVAVVSESAQKSLSVPWAQLQGARKMLGLMSRAVWGIDLTKTFFMGITGTNGKTTTAFLFQNLFNIAYGEGCSWMYGTVTYSMDGRQTPAQRTTPESSDIFRAMGRAAAKPKAVVMEVSSHALALDRVAGLLFDCAVWTNLTQDHLDYHKSMSDYYAAKKTLFTDYLKEGAKAVINIDDPWGMRLAGELVDRDVVTYGRSASARVRIVDADSSPAGTNIVLQTPRGTLRFGSKLSGYFNIYNMTAMVAGALALSMDTDVVSRCFATMETVPGRMERVALNADFSVFVDYAHTPDALDNVLSTARKFTSGKLICVFGCGGDRDMGKRPLMGAAAARHCDETVITSDNPRGEDPRAIIRDILQGFPLDIPHAAIVDRRDAIEKALRDARSGDCVVIAGKGHEDYQEIKGVRRHFSDRETVVAVYEKGGMSHA